MVLYSVFISFSVLSLASAFRIFGLDGPCMLEVRFTELTSRQYRREETLPSMLVFTFRGRLAHYGSQRQLLWRRSTAAG